MNLEALGRAAAFAVLAGTLLVTAITMSREAASTQIAKTDTPVLRHRLDADADPLEAELAALPSLTTSWSA